MLRSVTRMVKPFVTTSDVTMRIIEIMDSAWDRLRLARKRWMERHPDHRNAEDAARHFGWKPVTYRSHERAPEDNGRAFGVEWAKTYADAYGVSWRWLLAGEGQPVDTDQARLAPVIGCVGANPEGAVLFATGQDSGDLAPIPPGGTDRAVALEVRGHSMRGLADDGALIYFEYQRSQPTRDMFGSVVIVQLRSGEVLVKRLLKGSRPGVFDLESIAGPTIEDAEIDWAAEVTAIIPPRQARKIIVRSGTPHETRLRYVE
jgi:hypothetical protein